MWIPVVVALIAAVAALITSILTVVEQRRTTKLQSELTSRREDAQRAAELQRIMIRYRQPLLHATTDLQSRLYNIVRGHLLEIYGRGTEDERRYTIENSLFVFGEYFGWVEALRREVQFLDLGVDEQNRQVQACLEAIARAFLRDDLEEEFRVFRGQQRAIGELMVVSRSGGSGLECIGMATFSTRLADPQFLCWFRTLKDDLEHLTKQSRLPLQRITELQWRLIDLIDCLDPQGLRVPNARRQRL